MLMRQGVLQMNNALLTGRMASTMRIVALSMRVEIDQAPLVMIAASAMIRNDKDGLARSLAKIGELRVQDESPVMGVTVPAIMQDMQMFSKGHEGIFRMRPAIDPRDDEFISALSKFSQWNAAAVAADAQDDLENENDESQDFQMG